MALHCCRDGTGCSNPEEEEKNKNRVVKISLYYSKKHTLREFYCIDICIKIMIIK